VWAHQIRKPRKCAAFSFSRLASRALQDHTTLTKCSLQKLPLKQLGEIHFGIRAATATAADTQIVTNSKILFSSLLDLSGPYSALN